jgi:hypothetical protein
MVWRLVTSCYSCKDSLHRDEELEEGNQEGTEENTYESVDDLSKPYILGNEFKMENLKKVVGAYE